MNKKINQYQKEKYELLWQHEWEDLHKVGPSVRTRNRVIVKYFRKHLQKGSIFDSGCGNGAMIQRLNKQFGNSFSYSGGDISETAISFVKKLPFVQNAKIIDIENSDTLPKEKYSAVISSEVLEHIESWKTSLQNLLECVEEKGYIFITVPAQMRYWSKHDEFANHYRRFEIGEIETELEKSGFEIKESICWGWPFYWLYYSLILNKADPRKTMQSSTSPLKVLASNILYGLFFFDDLYNTRFGRRFFIIAQQK